MSLAAVDTGSFCSDSRFFFPINNGSDTRDVPIIKRKGNTGVGLFAIPGMGGSIWDPNTRFFDSEATKSGHAFVSFGYSDFNGPEAIIRDFSIPRMIAEGIEVFNSQTEGPQVIVASSFGANVALTLMRDHPKRVKGVVLLSPGTEVMRDLIDPILAAGNEAAGLQRRSQFETRGYCTIPIIYHDKNGERRTRAVRAHRQDVLDAAKKEIFSNSVSLTVGAEVIILHDPNDDRIPISSSADLAKKVIICGDGENLRHPLLIETPGAGHDHNQRVSDQKVVLTHIDRLLLTVANNLG